MLDPQTGLKLVDFNNGTPLQGGDLLQKAMGSAAPKKNAKNPKNKGNENNADPNKQA